MKRTLQLKDMPVIRFIDTRTRCECCHKPTSRGGRWEARLYANPDASSSVLLRGYGRTMRAARKDLMHRIQLTWW